MQRKRNYTEVWIKEKKVFLRLVNGRSFNEYVVQQIVAGEAIEELNCLKYIYIYIYIYT